MKGCRQKSGRNESAVNQMHWKRLVGGEKKSRDRLAVALGLLGMEHEIMQNCAGTQMYAKKPVGGSRGGTECGQGVAGGVATQWKMICICQA